MILSKTTMILSKTTMILSKTRLRPPDHQEQLPDIPLLASLL